MMEIDKFLGGIVLMNKDAFGKLSWGFFFIMLDFRLQGFDVLPDIIGYILFASGLSVLDSFSEYCCKAKSLNVTMIILSIFSIYERPVNTQGVHIGSLGPLGIVIGLVSVIVSLMVIYNMFMGIGQIAREKQQMGLSDEAEKRWTHYLTLQIAALAVFAVMFIPVISMVYMVCVLAGYVIMTFIIMGFMKRCGEVL